MSAIGAALIFVTANLLWVFQQPDQGAAAAEIVTFYDESSDQIVISALLSLIAYAVLIVFASGLRHVLIELEGDGLLADVAFGGTLFALAAGAGAETVNMAAAQRASEAELTETLALALFDISFVLGSYVFAVGLGVLMLATSVAALRSRSLLPRWLAIITAMYGLALITPVAVFVAGVWALGPPVTFLLIVGVALMREPRRDRAGREPPGLSPWAHRRPRSAPLRRRKPRPQTAGLAAQSTARGQRWRSRDRLPVLR